jgi:hypothetical protein
MPSGRQLFCLGNGRLAQQGEIHPPTVAHLLSSSIEDCAIRSLNVRHRLCRPIGRHRAAATSCFPSR